MKGNTVIPKTSMYGDVLVAKRFAQFVTDPSSHRASFQFHHFQVFYYCCEDLQTHAFLEKHLKRSSTTSVILAGDSAADSKSYYRL